MDFQPVTFEHTGAGSAGYPPGWAIPTSPAMAGIRPKGSQDTVEPEERPQICTRPWVSLGIPGALGGLKALEPNIGKCPRMPQVISYLN